MVKKFSANKRKELITDQVLKQGFVSVEDLMSLTHVSRMTIHRDLDELEKLKIIRKVRNGASAQPSSLFESDFRFRETRNINEKIAMCKLANRFIKNGTSVYLDDSTTVLPLIDLLGEKKLTIISACIPIINNIIEQDNIKLIVLGGNYNPKYRSNYGEICLNTLRNLNPDMAIMSSVAYKNGAVFQSEECILSIKKAMMKSATRKMLLLDHTKFNNNALYHLAEISQYNYIILDKHTPSEIVKEFREYNKNVYITS